MLLNRILVSEEEILTSMYEEGLAVDNSAGDRFYHVRRAQENKLNTKNFTGRVKRIYKQKFKEYLVSVYIYKKI